MKIKYTFANKVSAFLITILMFTLTLGCILGVILMTDADVYSLSKEEFLEDQYHTHMEHDMASISHWANGGDMVPDYIAALEQFCEKRNFAAVEIWKGYSNYIEIKNSKCIWSWNAENAEPGYSESKVLYIRSDHADYSVAWLKIKITLTQEPFSIQDGYYDSYRLVSFLYTMRFGIFAIMILSLILAILGFVYLMYASGRHHAENNVHAGWGTAIPFDLLTVACILISGFFISSIVGLFEDASGPTAFISITAMAILSEIILLGWSMSFALRSKLGNWWKNTLIFHLGCFVRKSIKGIIKGIAATVNYIPFIWKIVLAVFIVTLSELLILILAWENGTLLFLCWIIEKIISIPIILYVTILLYKLKSYGNLLATGNFNHSIDTKYMFWDLKQHGENLNNIANGMSFALEERLKSERLKTELITNVSHDIKTPLTSIINYADLLNKEMAYYEFISNKSTPSETTSIEMDREKFEKVQNYSSVLLRHSERLKRLIEDLIEASKAATGNIEVHLESCDAAIMLTQAAGEYEQRLESAGLTLITKQPEQPIQIEADSRRLWRIFDNLLNNICKYAQTGTRVYLTLEKQNDFAVITFKNTSRDALDVSSDELMERFVRGDFSRHTEGNGLGLSIAKSLTELQNGTMNLTIDGDLFKVTLRFPVIH